MFGSVLVLSRPLDIPEPMSGSSKISTTRDPKFDVSNPDWARLVRSVASLAAAKDALQRLGARDNTGTAGLRVGFRVEGLGVPHPTSP